MAWYSLNTNSKEQGQSMYISSKKSFNSLQCKHMHAHAYINTCGLYQISHYTLASQHNMSFKDNHHFNKEFKVTILKSCDISVLLYIINLRHIHWEENNTLYHQQQ